MQHLAACENPNGSRSPARTGMALPGSCVGNWALGGGRLVFLESVAAKTTEERRSDSNPSERPSISAAVSPGPGSKYAEQSWQHASQVTPRLVGAWKRDDLVPLHFRTG